MIRAGTAVFLILSAMLAGGGVRAAGEKGRVASYAGSDQCRACHPTMYDGWVKTFHATVVQDARKNPQAVLGDFSAKNLGFTLADVEYTIGGHWDQRYMKRIGDDYYVLPKLWSVQSMSWRPYNVWSWKKMPYGKYCKGCHVTGFDPGGKEAAEQSVGCEACHGPGREHVESKGKKPIVNPRKLPDDRREMICAACHVRGQDPTGTYYFPVGYLPGDDLGTFYQPLDKAPDETNTQAIQRLFAKWKEDRSSNAKVKCDVCGIYGSEENPKAEGAKDPSEFCFGCHAFKEKFAEHTRHRLEAKLVCLDCHVQQASELMNPQNLDIHSYGYFLVHTDNCYDPRIERACRKCHKDKADDWAARTVEMWRRPVEVDH